MRRLLPIAAAVALAATLFHAPMAWACSCVADTTPQKQFKAADVVFVGSVRNISTPDSAIGDVLAQMTITQVYKGSVSVVAGVHTSANVAGCGVAFVVGSRYTVFASSTNGTYRANLCGGTTNDVGVLTRAGFHAGTPLAQVSVPRIDSRGTVDRTGLLAGAALLIALVGAGFITLQRLRAGRHRPDG
jgi:hypothetical protein